MARFVAFAAIVTVVAVLYGFSKIFPFKGTAMYLRSQETRRTATLHDLDLGYGCFLFIGLAALGTFLSFTLLFGLTYLLIPEPSEAGELTISIGRIIAFIAMLLVIPSLVAAVVGLTKARRDWGLKVLSAFTVGLPLPFLLVSIFQWEGYSVAVLGVYLSMFCILCVALPLKWFASRRKVFQFGV